MRIVRIVGMTGVPVVVFVNVSGDLHRRRIPCRCLIVLDDVDSGILSDGILGIGAGYSDDACSAALRFRRRPS